MDIYTKPGHLIRRCHQISVAIFLEECNGFNITPVQYGILSSLREKGTVEQVALAGLVAIDRSTIGNVLGRLEERGLITRVGSTTDKRIKNCLLTEKGIKLLAQLDPRIAEVQSRLLAPLETKEQKLFMDYLSRIARTHNDVSRAPLKPEEESSQK